MRIPEPYFSDIPDIGDLYMDYIILEYDYPLLFVCKDRKWNRLFLCDCCDTYEEQRWLIAPVTEQILLNLLNNDMTIRDAFLCAEANCCVATWSKGYAKERYKIVSSDEFEEDDLPEKGVFLEAEEEEYDSLKQYILDIIQIKLNQYDSGRLMSVDRQMYDHTFPQKNYYHDDCYEKTDFEVTRIFAA